MNRRWEFRSASKSAKLGIVAHLVMLVSIVEQIKLQPIILLALAIPTTNVAFLREFAQLPSDVLCAIPASLLLLLPSCGNLQHHLLKVTTASLCSLAGGPRPVCSSKDWFQLWCDKDVEWPASSACCSLDEVHILPVDIWSFFAINLDWDEILIEQLSYSRVVKGLVGHDMAPMAGGVPNADEEQSVGSTSELERLWCP